MVHPLSVYGAPWSETKQEWGGHFMTWPLLSHEAPEELVDHDTSTLCFVFKWVTLIQQNKYNTFKFINLKHTRKKGYKNFWN